MSGSSLTISMCWQQGNEQLGFTLTLLARQEDGRIGNRCAMLRRSYIELLAVVDPTAKSATLDRFLERYAGIHIMAFSIDDPQSALTRLRGAGIDVAGISQLSLGDRRHASCRWAGAICANPDPRATGRSHKPCTSPDAGVAVAGAFPDACERCRGAGRGGDRRRGAGGDCRALFTAGGMRGGARSGRRISRSI